MEKIDFDQKFYLIVSGIVTKPDGKVLILFSKKVGKWTLPGGKVEPGESPVTALIREIKEETNLSVFPVNFLGAINYNFNDSYVVNLLYEAKVLEGVASNLEPNKHKEIDFVERSKIPEIFASLVK